MSIIPASHPANNTGVLAALDRLGRAVYDYTKNSDAFDPERHAEMLASLTDEKVLNGAVLYLGSLTLADLVTLFGAPGAVTMIDTKRQDVEQQTEAKKATAMYDPR